MIRATTPDRMTAEAMNKKELKVEVGALKDLKIADDLLGEIQKVEDLKQLRKIQVKIQRYLLGKKK